MPEEFIRLQRERDSSDLNQETFCRQKPISIATLHRWPLPGSRLFLDTIQMLVAPEIHHIPDNHRRCVKHSV